jgi:hypothetical protein
MYPCALHVSGVPGSSVNIPLSFDVLLENMTRPRTRAAVTPRRGGEWWSFGYHTKLRFQYIQPMAYSQHRHSNR